MPIRGQRSIWPKAPTPSAGLFGKRNSKSTADFPEQGAMKYAHSTNTRNRPHKGDGGSSAAKKFTSQGNSGYEKAMNKKARA